MCRVQMGPMLAKVGLILKFGSQSALSLDSDLNRKWQNSSFSGDHLTLFIFIHHEKQHIQTRKLPVWQSIAVNMRPSFGFVKSVGFIVVPKMERFHFSACIPLHSACCQLPDTHREKVGEPARNPFIRNITVLLLCALLCHFQEDTEKKNVISS